MVGGGGVKTLKIFGLLWFGTLLFMQLMLYSFSPEYVEAQKADWDSAQHIMVFIVELLAMIAFSAILASLLDKGGKNE